MAPKLTSLHKFSQIVIKIDYLKCIYYDQVARLDLKVNAQNTLIDAQGH